jgi:hypothetical protein
MGEPPSSGTRRSTVWACFCNHVSFADLARSASPGGCFGAGFDVVWISMGANAGEVGENTGEVGE